MALRLIEMVLKENDSTKVSELLKEHKMLEHRHIRLSQGEVLVRILLLGSGYVVLSMVALSLFLMNLICINLAGVVTFLFQGIHPTTWLEKGHAAKATFIAISLWVVLLAVLVGLILLLRKDLI